MKVPNELGGLFHGKSESEMDGLGVPHFRKFPVE